MAMRTIAFDELVPGSDGVRITEDGLIWALDLVMVVTGKNNNEAGEVLRRLKHDIFDSSKLLETHLTANGGKKTKLVSFDHALELVMVLPGKVAKEFRVQACDILKRFFAGDQSLHAEINRNSASSAPIHAMARGELPECISGVKRIHSEIAEAETALVKVDNMVQCLETRLTGIKTVMESVDLTQLIRIYELEGSIPQKLTLETAKAQFASEAHSRAETAKDADLVRLDKRLAIEAKYKAIINPVVHPIVHPIQPVPIPLESMQPAPLNKTVLQLASEQPYWRSLTKAEKNKLVRETGYAITKAGIDPDVEKVIEKTLDGASRRVNTFHLSHHPSIISELDDKHMQLRPVARGTPCIQLFFGKDK